MWFHLFDIVPKPFTAHEVRAQIEHALSVQEFEVEKLKWVPDAETPWTAPVEIKPLPRRWHRARLDVSMALLDILDTRVPGERSRATRVVDYVQRLGQELGLEEPVLQAAAGGALLRDIGKCLLPDRLIKADASSEEHSSYLLEHGPAGAGLGAQHLWPRLAALSATANRSVHRAIDRRHLVDDAPAVRFERLFPVPINVRFRLQSRN